MTKFLVKIFKDQSPLFYAERFIALRLCAGTLWLYKQLHVACLLGIFPLLASCSGIYLHDRKIETMTQAAKDDFGKISIDQYFTEERTRIANFASREDAAVLAYMVASRDRQLTQLIRKDVLQGALSTEKKSFLGSLDEPLQLLENFVNDRMLKIIGKQSVDTGILYPLKNKPIQLALAKERLEANRSFYQSALQDFNRNKSKDKLDPRPTECNEVPKSSVGLPDSTSSDTHYVRLVEACAEIANVEAQISSIRKSINPAEGSTLVVTWERADAARSIMDQQNKEAARLIKLIEELQKSATESNTQSEAEAKIIEIRNLLQNAKGLTKFVGAKHISEILEGILAADLKANTPATMPTTTTPKEEATRQTILALKLTDALAKSADAFAEFPQIKRVNSLLIALIEQRQKLDMAKLESNRQQDLLRIYEAQETALLQELAYLAVTKILNMQLRSFSFQGEGGGFATTPIGTKEPGPTVGAALAAYSSSWNQGQIPFQLLQFNEVQVARAYHVESVAKSAQNWQHLLAPAIDELAAFGKGGIRPETIATVMSNLGIIAAIGAK